MSTKFTCKGMSSMVEIAKEMKRVRMRASTMNIADMMMELEKWVFRTTRML